MFLQPHEEYMSNDKRTFGWMLFLYVLGLCHVIFGKGMLTINTCYEAQEKHCVSTNFYTHTYNES